MGRAKTLSQGPAGKVPDVNTTYYLPLPPWQGTTCCVPCQGTQECMPVARHMEYGLIVYFQSQALFALKCGFSTRKKKKGDSCLEWAAARRRVGAQQQAAVTSGLDGRREGDAGRPEQLAAQRAASSWGAGVRCGDSCGGRPGDSAGGDLEAVASLLSRLRRAPFCHCCPAARGERSWGLAGRRRGAGLPASGCWLMAQFTLRKYMDAQERPPT